VTTDAFIEPFSRLIQHLMCFCAR